MPAPGDIDQSYPYRLLEIGIRINEPFMGAKHHHHLKCEICSHEWVATPVSKLQNYKKHGIKGCPLCSVRAKYESERADNIKKITDRGLVILSDWDGRNAEGAKCTPIYVTVKNTKCGHTFTSNAVNLLRTSMTCTVCGVEERSKQLTQTSYDRSEEWRQTATEWKIYKSTVTKLSRVSYQQNKHLINPDNLPTGKAGTEGAYHIDHIVPIRYCYNNSIPPDICAHHTNLQMLGWRENVGSRDKLKDTIPAIFEGYIK